MTKRRLIFDSDGGVDDAQALLMMIANGRTPDLITSVFGNVSLEQATNNLLCVAAVAGVTIPVHAGAAGPMVQPIIDARHVHGDDGLGGAPRPRYDATPASRDGIGVMRKTFREAAASGEKVDLMMIGPLTNLAFALKLEPSIIEGIGTLWVMGATVYGRGNTTTAAEFNIYADPEAAQIVLTAGIETIIAPYDACTEHVLSGADLDALHEATAPGTVRDFMKALSDHQRKLRKGWGRPDSILYVDPLAAAVCIAPQSITKSIVASTAVVLDQGIARGMTLVDPANRLETPRVTFVERADQRTLDDIYKTTLAYVPQKAFETT